MAVVHGKWGRHKAEDVNAGWYLVRQCRSTYKIVRLEDMELFNSNLPCSSWVLCIICPFKHLDAAKFPCIALLFYFSSVPFEMIEYHL